MGKFDQIVLLISLWKLSVIKIHLTPSVLHNRADFFKKALVRSDDAV